MSVDPDTVLWLIDRWRLDFNQSNFATRDRVQKLIIHDLDNLYATDEAICDAFRNYVDSVAPHHRPSWRHAMAHIRGRLGRHREPDTCPDPERARWLKHDQARGLLQYRGEMVEPGSAIALSLARRLKPKLRALTRNYRTPEAERRPSVVRVTDDGRAETVEDVDDDEMPF